MKYGMLTFLLLLAAFPLYAQNTDSPTCEPYIRAVHSDSGDARLDVAIRELENAAGGKLYLVGAVHIGDRAYYQAVQALLDRCDTVLFECASALEMPLDLTGSDTMKVQNTNQRLNVLQAFVAEFYYYHKRLPRSLKEMRLSMLRRGRSVDIIMLRSLACDGFGAPFVFASSDSSINFTTNPDSAFDIAALPPYTPQFNIQRELARALKLEFQMAHIRYDRKKFVHCDMPLEDLYGVAVERGINPDELGSLREMTEGEGFPMMIAQAALFFIRTMPNAGAIVKYMLIDILPEQIDAVEKISPALGELILKARNEVVIEALTHCAASPDTYAVFYGAAHLAEIEQYAVDTLHYTVRATHYLPAMQVNISETGLPPEMFQQIRDEFNRQINTAIKQRTTERN